MSIGKVIYLFFSSQSYICAFLCLWFYILHYSKSNSDPIRWGLYLSALEATCLHPMSTPMLTSSPQIWLRLFWHILVLYAPFNCTTNNPLCQCCLWKATIIYIWFQSKCLTTVRFLASDGSENLPGLARLSLQAFFRRQFYFYPPKFLIGFPGLSGSLWSCLFTCC